MLFRSSDVDVEICESEEGEEEVVVVGPTSELMVEVGSPGSVDECGSSWEDMGLEGLVGGSFEADDCGSEGWCE